MVWIQQATMCLTEWNQADTDVEMLREMCSGDYPDALTHPASVYAQQTYVEALSEWAFSDPVMDRGELHALNDEIVSQVVLHEVAWRDIRQTLSVWRESVMTLTAPDYGMARA